MLNRGVSAYAAIQARVRAMYSTLFAAPDWAVLCEADEFSLLIEAIRPTAYGPYLSRVEQELLTPRRAIFQIKQRMADTYLAVRIIPDL